MPDLQEATKFLESLWPDGVGAGVLLCWQLRGRRSFWTRDTHAAAKHCAGKDDQYIGVCLSPQDFGGSSRCKADQTVAACGVWADIDYQCDDAHKRPDLPPNEESAYTLIADCGLRPTVIVHSGHGLQPWWLFHDRLDFNDDQTRRRFSEFVQNWQESLRSRAERRGWTIDATHDLARVMRIPGTLNAKDPDRPVPVRLVVSDGPRYEWPGDFDGFMVDRSTDVDKPIPGTRESPSDAFDWESDTQQPLPPEGRSRASRGEIEGVDIVVDAQASPPFDRLMAALSSNPRLRRTWERKRSDLKDETPSGYCMSLANQFAEMKWSAQEIADTLIAWRRSQPDAQFKAHASWYQATIAHAYASLSQSAELEQQAVQSAAELRELEELSEKVREGDESARNRALEIVRRILGLDLEAFVQDGREGAVYSFRMRDGTEHTIGTRISASILQHEVFAITNRPPKVTGKNFQLIWGALGALVEYHEPTTTNEQMEEWIDKYVGSGVGTRDYESRHEAMNSWSPFRDRDGTVWFPVDRLVNFIHLSGGRITHNLALSILRRIGYRRKTWLYTRPNGQHTSRSLWGKKSDTAPIEGF